MAHDLQTNNTTFDFMMNATLLISINMLTGAFSLVASILLILFNYKNIRKQIIEEGGFVKWLKNFTNFKK